MQTDDIALAKERREISELNVRRRVFRRGARCQHFHAKSSREFSDRFSNAPITDNAHRQAIEFD